MLINVMEYLARAAVDHREKTALVDPTQSLTFDDVDFLTRRIAASIGRQTDRTGRPIAVLLPKSADAVLSLFGTLRSGNAYVPLDVKSPLKRLEGILSDLDPLLVITDAAHEAVLAEAGIDASKRLRIDEAKGTDAADNAAAERWQSLIDTDPAYIIYTSGSTGTPKGVVIPHRGIIDYIEWARNSFDVRSDAVIGNQAPLTFDNSTLDLYLCLSAGATLVVVPEEMYVFPVKLLDYIDEQRISFLFWVPSVLSAVAKLDLLKERSLPHLRKVLFAGEVMPTRHLNYWRQHLPHVLFANLYGPTEITVDCTYFIVDREFDDLEPLPIGFPCRNSDVLVLNDHDRRAGVDEVGELCVRGSSLALGYWNNPERTARAFCQNPLNPHFPERIYRTGDLVYTNARNEIMFVGRKDSQIKHQGYRIELGEIENAVFQLAGIQNACVLYDTGSQCIALFFEAARPLHAAEIRQGLKVYLPKYMLPTAIHQLDQLPLNANGKIDRKALAEEYLATPRRKAG